MVCTSQPYLILDFTRVDDGDLLFRTPGVRSLAFDVVDDFRALEDLTEHDVPSVQPGGLHRRDEELRPVRILPTVGHTQVVRTLVLELYMEAKTASTKQIFHQRGKKLS